VTEFARRASDFWSCRSVVFRFVGNDRHVRRTISRIGTALYASLNREQLQLIRQHLEHLEREHDEAGDTPGHAVDLLVLLAQVDSYEDYPDLV
jgi:hypothetical protein